MDANKEMVRTISLAKDLWQKVSIYQHANMLNTRVDAIRQMLTEAYDAWVLRKDASEN